MFWRKLSRRSKRESTRLIRQQVSSYDKRSLICSKLWKKSTLTNRWALAPSSPTLRYRKTSLMISLGELCAPLASTGPMRMQRLTLKCTARSSASSLLTRLKSQTWSRFGSKFWTPPLSLCKTTNNSSICSRGLRAEACRRGQHLSAPLLPRNC